MFHCYNGELIGGGGGLVVNQLVVTNGELNAPDIDLPPDRTGYE